MKTCERCHAEVTAEGPVCPSCGQPLVTPAFSHEDTDAELARANLSRLRGDLAEAERICLEVLRRFPNERAAGILLGQVLLAAGRAEEARHWFELVREDDPANREAMAGLKAIADAPRTIVAGSAATRVWVYVLLITVLGSAGIAIYRANSSVAALPNEQVPIVGEHKLDLPAAPKTTYEQKLARRLLDRRPEIKEALNPFTMDWPKQTLGVPLKASRARNVREMLEWTIGIAQSLFGLDDQLGHVRVSVTEGKDSAVFTATYNRDVSTVDLTKATDQELLAVTHEAIWDPRFELPPANSPPSDQSSPGTGSGPADPPTNPH